MSRKAERRASTPLSRADQAIVEEHLPLRSPVVYEVVRQEGEAELRRPVSSLWWSGLAAGVAMVFSVLGQAVLSDHLPDAPWAALISKLGYCSGFLIVVLGRVQLFTENTVTAVLPLLAEWSRARLGHTARLWGVVLLANIVGTFVTAALGSRAGLIPPAHVAAMVEVAAGFAENSLSSAFLYGVPAGFLIAAIVWVMPSAETARFSIVVWFTYLIALGDFTHVVVGSAELSLLLVSGGIDILRATGLLLATLAGNIIGGTGLFALLAHAQIKEEM